MTRGKDCGILFIDIEKNIATTNMELKKLIFLYLMYYSKNHPDKAILAINTLRKDAYDLGNPLLRALAIRTMGCIRVKQITEYLLDPLKNGLKDEDSYVRKTAVLCVAKLYDLNPELLEDQGFVKILQSMVNDGNAFVVSNTLAALAAMSEEKGVDLINLKPSLVQKLLAAINECNEWGQISILDAIGKYEPADSREAESIMDRVQARLLSQNPGIILSAIKIIMKYLDYIQSPEKIRAQCRKLENPLITLMGNEPEIQYIVLKNINLIIQKRPTILEKKLKIFTCNYNDPIYIKLEKLDILIQLANADNIQQILHELKEYSQEIDVEFARKSIKAIGRCAIKIERAVDKCMHALWEFLKTNVNYIIQETIIVIRDIFRKYPKKYEGILKDLCENLKTLEDPEAKASIVWIIGEYVETIENADDLLSNFIENFKEEAAIVQLQILTSTVKLFLHRPEDCKDMIQSLLKVVTTECENPDLRERGFIYWRLLSINPLLTKNIVLATRPPISDQSYTLESEFLDQYNFLNQKKIYYDYYSRLIPNIGSLSSVYKKTPQTFVKKLRDVINLKEREENQDIEDADELLDGDHQVDDDIGGGYGDMFEDNSTPQQTNTIDDQKQQPNDDQNDLDLLGDGEDVMTSTQTSTQPSVSIPRGENISIPFFGAFASNQEGQNNKITGVAIEGAFQKSNNQPYLELRITNDTNSTLSGFQIKFNSNSFKLSPEAIDVNINPIMPGTQQSGYVNVNFQGQSSDQPSFPYKIQIALKTNLDVFTFTVPCCLSVILDNAAPLTPQQYMEFSQNQNLVRSQNVVPTSLTNIQIQEKFAKNNIQFVGSRKNPAGVELVSYSCKLVNGFQCLLDTINDTNTQQLKLNYLVPHQSITQLFLQAIQFIINYPSQQ